MKCYGVATPAIVTIPQYLEEGNPQSFLYIFITLGVTVVSTFIITYVIGFEDPVEEDDEEMLEEKVTIPLNTRIKYCEPFRRTYD